MDIRFNAYGNQKQLEAFKYWADKETKVLVYGGSKGSGKSYLGCSLICGNALIYPGTRYFIARRTLNDLVKHTLTSVIEVLDFWKIPHKQYKYNGQARGIFFANGSRIDFIGAKYLPSDPHYHRFGSSQYTQGWIEEGGEFAEDAFENLTASIGRWKNLDFDLTGKVLITCNPAKNFLYDFYNRDKNGKLNDDEKFIQALPRDNKTKPGYEQHLRKTLRSQSAIERLVEGNWEFDDDPAVLMDFNNILDIFENDFDTLKGKPAITADVARYGSDKAVIMLWNGWRVEKIFTLDVSSIPDQVELIKSISVSNSVPRSRIVVDDDGVGGGVSDYLPGCQRFINNSSPVDEVPNQKSNFASLKDQCAFKFADRVNDHGVYINCPDTHISAIIKKELEAVKDATHGQDTKKRVISKDEMKKLLNHSPDYFDALKMREYLDLKKPSGLEKAKIKVSREVKAQWDYLDHL